MGRCWSGSVCCLLSPLFDSLLDSVPLFFGGRGELVVYGANVCLVIILIAAEILVAAINIVVDLYAGVE
jgi:hypothetical protein